MTAEEAFFRAIREGNVQGVTSVITLTECLVRPLRTGDTGALDAYINLLTITEGISLVSVSAEIARRAAQLRAGYGLRTPDAPRLATALESGGEAFFNE